jgi:hypothetical protein
MTMRPSQRVGIVLAWLALLPTGLAQQTQPKAGLSCAPAGRVFYASPSGGGGGISPEAPFRVKDFWSIAAPGDTLVLLDGVYRGMESMINPPPELRGLEGLPITVQALHEGAVLLDGEGTRIPILLKQNDYFVIEGLNAHDSSGSVVSLSGSSHNVIRRICAYDAADGNAVIFGVHHGVHNLLEDCAGWGIARKIFSSSQGGDWTTFRRCWGRWEGSHVVGPKMVFAFAYNAYDNRLENCIGAWTAGRMQRTYTLMGYDGRSWRGSTGGLYTGYRVDQPYGIFAVDALYGDKAAHAELLGCIAYTTTTGRPVSFAGGFFVTKVDDVLLADCLAMMARPNRPFVLATHPPRGRGLVARRLVGVGAPSSIHPDWADSDVVEYATIGELSSGRRVGASIELNRRYVDGQLTDQPLWPWPMDQRIHDAMVQAGYDDPVWVTQTIQRLAGPLLKPAQ